MSIERDHASVRSISAMASSTRSVGRRARCRGRRRPARGAPSRGSPMTVGIDRSSGTLPSGSGGGSATGLGAHEGDGVPSPLPAQGVPRHEAGRVAADHRVASTRPAPPASTGPRRSCRPRCFCMARLHRALTPTTRHGGEGGVETQPPDETGAGHRPGCEPAHLLGGPSLGPPCAPEHGEHRCPGGQPGDRRHVVAGLRTRRGRPWWARAPRPGALDDGRVSRPTGIDEGQGGETPVGAHAPGRAGAPRPSRRGAREPHSAVVPSRHAACRARAPPGRRDARTVEVCREAEPQGHRAELADERRHRPATRVGPGVGEDRGARRRSRPRRR